MGDDEYSSPVANNTLCHEENGDIKRSCALLGGSSFGAVDCSSSYDNANNLNCERLQEEEKGILNPHPHSGDERKAKEATPHLKVPEEEYGHSKFVEKLNFDDPMRRRNPSSNEDSDSSPNVSTFDSFLNKVCSVHSFKEKLRLSCSKRKRSLVSRSFSHRLPSSFNLSSKSTRKIHQHKNGGKDVISSHPLLSPTAQVAALSFTRSQTSYSQLLAYAGPEIRGSVKAFTPTCDLDKLRAPNAALNGPIVEQNEFFLGNGQRYSSTASNSFHKEGRNSAKSLSADDNSITGGKFAVNENISSWGIIKKESPPPHCGHQPQLGGPKTTTTKAHSLWNDESPRLDFTSSLAPPAAKCPFAQTVPPNSPFIGSPGECDLIAIPSPGVFEESSSALRDVSDYGFGLGLAKLPADEDVAMSNNLQNSVMEMYRRGKVMLVPFEEAPCKAGLGEGYSELQEQFTQFIPKEDLQHLKKTCLQTPIQQQVDEQVSYLQPIISILFIT